MECNGTQVYLAVPHPAAQDTEYVRTSSGEKERSFKRQRGLSVAEIDDVCVILLYILKGNMMHEWQIESSQLNRLCINHATT